MTERIPYRERMRSRIREYEPDDLDALLELRRVLFGDESFIASASYVTWLYGRSDPPTLLVYCVDGRLEGFHGSIATTMWIDGKPTPTMWAVELFVSPAQLLRGAGAVLAEQAAVGQRLILGFEVSDAARKALLRTGWADVGDVALFSRPLASGPFSRARGRPLPQLVAGGLDLALRAQERLAAGARRARGSRLVEIERFDERADALWTSVAGQYAVIARRDASWLNWRFAEYPQDGYYRCFYLERHGAVIGYAVLRIEPRDGISAGWIVDFLCQPRAAPSLLLACAERLRRDGAQAVYCIQQERHLVRRMKAAGFLRRSSGFPLMAFAEALPQADRAKLLDAGNWFITAGDSNVDRPRAEPAEQP